MNFKAIDFQNLKLSVVIILEVKETSYPLENFGSREGDSGVTPPTHCCQMSQYHTVDNTLDLTPLDLAPWDSSGVIQP